MRFTPLAACGLAASLIGYLAVPLAAQTPEQLVFIPAGGRTLLTEIANSKPPADELKALLTGKHARDEWVSYLKAHTKALPALQRMSDKEQLTVADYLAFNMPLQAAQVPANLARADWPHVLPKDGRDLALEHCQGCHIITVVVTQDRTKKFWVGTLNTPAHAIIKITPDQRQELASYLELNANIPIDQVPEELRAAGATY